VQKIIQIVALVWLVAIAAFALGMYVNATQAWPYGLIQELRGFAAGNAAEETTLVEKVANDLDVHPSRHIVRPKRPFGNEDGFVALDGLPIKSRRDSLRIRLTDGAPEGFRLIYGAFDFDETLHGAILIGPDGRVVNVWQVSQEGTEWQHRPDTNVYPHGIEISRDGSIVTAFDGGTSLVRYDWCGNQVWRIKGGFHHSIDFDENGGMWVWGRPGKAKPGGEYLVNVDFENGQVRHQILLDDVAAANPDIDPFGIRQEDSPEGSVWLHDRWHVNDIDALPAAYASRFPEFQAGDLLVSLRSINLVFVMDPETLRVKWWRQGLVRRQHDPDWRADGRIAIFDNNMHRGYSRIVEIDPKTFEYSTAVPGAPYEFETWMRGKHQPMPDGGYLITSTQQGRVFETGPNGEIDFEFLNVYDGRGELLVVSEARFLARDFFGELPKCQDT